MLIFRVRTVTTIAAKQPLPRPGETLRMLSPQCPLEPRDDIARQGSIVLLSTLVTRCVKPICERRVEVPRYSCLAKRSVLARRALRIALQTRVARRAAVGTR